MGTPTTTGAGGALLTQLRDKVTPKRFWWGLLVALLGIAGLFGGLKTAAPKDSYAELTAGQSHDSGQFRVTVNHARIELMEFGRPLDVQLPGAGYVFLVVDTTVENLSDETAEPAAGSDREGPGLVQVGLRRDKLFNAENVRRTGYLPTGSHLIQPGMTDHVVFMWGITRETVHVGTPLFVQVNNFENSYFPGLNERWQWTPNLRHAIYQLTIQDSA